MVYSACFLLTFETLIDELLNTSLQPFSFITYNFVKLNFYLEILTILFWNSISFKYAQFHTDRFQTESVGRNTRMEIFKGFWF